MTPVTAVLVAVGMTAGPAGFVIGLVAYRAGSQRGYRAGFNAGIRFARGVRVRALLKARAAQRGPVDEPTQLVPFLPGRHPVDTPTQLLSTVPRKDQSCLRP